MAHVTLDVLVSSTLQQSQSGGGNVELSDLVLLDNVPVAGEVGVGGSTLEDDGRDTEQQRGVDDIGVASDPTDITTAEVTVTVVNVKDVLAGQGSAEQVAGSGVQDTLGLAGRTGGVEEEERVLRIHDLGSNIAGPLVELVVPPDITSGLHGHIGTSTLEDENVGDVGALLERIVDNLLGSNELTTALALIGSNDNARASVNNTVSQRVCRETGKDHGVNGTDTDTGQNGDQGLGNHGQVDGDGVTLADTHLLQGPGTFGDLAQQLAVSDIAAIGGLIGLVDDGNTVGIFEGVAINQVVAGVELTLGEPLDVAVCEGAAGHGIEVAIP